MIHWNDIIEGSTPFVLMGVVVAFFMATLSVVF